MAFPLHRYRRLRLTESLRTMVRETTLDPADFIAPMFVVPGEGIRQPIPSMPGIDRVSPDLAAKDAAELAARGVLSRHPLRHPRPQGRRRLLVGRTSGPGLPRRRDDQEGEPDDRRHTDVCLCEYTDHGHCGVIVEPGAVDNDATLPILAAEALAHAKAGADIVAPSDMMDGRVGAIREALDGDGFRNVPILRLRGQVRERLLRPVPRGRRVDAVVRRPPRLPDGPGQRPRGGARRSLSDVEEGADMVMVKPALSYLDVVRAAKEPRTSRSPTYNVSGEYAMVKAAAERGWIDGKRVTLEILTSMKRAGADLILTYHAKEAAEWLQGR